MNVFFSFGYKYGEIKSGISLLETGREKREEYPNQFDITIVTFPVESSHHLKPVSRMNVFFEAIVEHNEIPDSYVSRIREFLEQVRHGRLYL